jgi:hypothetical protein
MSTPTTSHPRSVTVTVKHTGTEAFSTIDGELADSVGPFEVAQ